MSSKNKCCQSCGLPWDKDPEAGGTNTDGSKNDLYCSYCFKDGKFVQADWQLEDMQAYALKILSKKGIPELIGKMLVNSIGNLERWKK